MSSYTSSRDAAASRARRGRRCRRPRTGRWLRARGGWRGPHHLASSPPGARRISSACSVSASCRSAACLSGAPWLQAMYSSAGPRARAVRPLLRLGLRAGGDHGWLLVFVAWPLGRGRHPPALPAWYLRARGSAAKPGRATVVELSPPGACGGCLLVKVPSMWHKTGLDVGARWYGRPGEARGAQSPRQGAPALVARTARKRACLPYVVGRATQR